MKFVLMCIFRYNYRQSTEQRARGTAPANRRHHGIEPKNHQPGCELRQGSSSDEVLGSHR